MINALINIARLAGKIIPSSSMRLKLLKIYFALVKNKKCTAKRDGIIYELDLSETIDSMVRIGVFENEVKAAIATHCRPSGIALDIGANIGAHALPIAAIVNRHGHVHAFEPTEYAYKKLTNNIRLNPHLNISAHRIALSDHNRKDVEINFRSSWRSDGSRIDGPCKVDFVTLDHWATSVGCNNGISFIKIDVDGNEYPIIAGGKQTLLRHRPIIVMEAVSLHFTSDATNPFLWLWNHGWKFRSIKADYEYSSILEIRNLLPSSDPEMTKSINLIALPKG